MKMIPFSTLALVLSVFSGCGSEATIERSAQFEFPGTPVDSTPTPAPSSIDLILSESEWTGDENSIPFPDMTPDTQSFLYRFTQDEALNFKVVRGNVFAAGCSMSAVQISYALVVNGTETAVAQSTSVAKPDGSDIYLKVTASGLSQCMGYGAGFLVVRQ